MTTNIATNGATNVATLPRKEERSVLTRQPKGVLSLHLHEQCLPVLGIRDFSPGGISLLLDQPIVDSVDIMLTYHYQEVELEVNGTVAWNRPDPATGTVGANGALYLLGVQLLGAYLLYTYLKNE
jgi:hypothetical protein